MTTRQADDGALGYGSPSVPHALQVFREVRDLGSADEDQGRGASTELPTWTSSASDPSGQGSLGIRDLKHREEHHRGQPAPLTRPRPGGGVGRSGRPGTRHGHAAPSAR
ncbi:hypothetical protein [Streptacidiphilus monticola]|uniref:Uncharacterized protein n=1 Tax=Streptacidiphilus monticola TaxID=2161674 RepID=A0ABW1FZJ5_9ACTN